MKLLYSHYGVQEYWTIDRLQRQVEIYSRDHAILQRLRTLFVNDSLSSPLLPGFECTVSQLI